MCLEMFLRMLWTVLLKITDDDDSLSLSICIYIYIYEGFIPRNITFVFVVKYGVHVFILKHAMIKPSNLILVR